MLTIISREELSVLDPAKIQGPLFGVGGQRKEEIQEADPADFQVKLWTIRGDGATYRDGEEQMQLIFPNRFFPDNFLRKGRV